MLEEECRGIKVDMPNVVTSLNWRHIFEWCAVCCGSKGGYQKEMCLKEIGLCGQYDNQSRCNN